MKATKKIIIMLMAITIGTLAASAQSANRGSTQREGVNKTSSSSNKSQKSSSIQRKNTNSRSVSQSHRPSNSQKTDSRTPSSRSGKAVKGQKQSSISSTQNSRSDRNYNRQSNSNRTVSAKPAITSSRSYNRPSAQKPNTSNNARNGYRKVSTTNNNNPRSGYRAPDNMKHEGKTYVDPKSRTSNKTYDHRYTVLENGVNNRHSHRYYPRKRVNIHVHPVTHQNHYRVMYYPSHRNIVWTRNMYRTYVEIYPGYKWRYPIGYNIQTIGAFEARFNVGEVSRIYGRVYATWHNRESDDLLLFFGGEYPNQEFTMIIPGHIARRYSWRPEKYFLGQHVIATGLITRYEGQPELIVKRKYQLEVY